MSEAVLKIDSYIEGNAGILKLNGEADAHTTPLLKEELEKLLMAGVKYVIYDCQNLTYISSAAIGATAQALKTLKERNGNVIFIETNPDIKNLIRMLIAQKVVILPNMQAAKNFIVNS